MNRSLLSGHADKAVHDLIPIQSQLRITVMASNATATNTAANAVDTSPQTIEGDGTLIASTPETGTNTVLADADHTNGDAKATATSNESAAVVDSNLNSEENANGNANVVVREHLSVTADAETTTGDADADAINDSNGNKEGSKSTLNKVDRGHMKKKKVLRCTAGYRWSMIEIRGKKGRSEYWSCGE